MNRISWLGLEFKRWLYNGANLITLSRLPMLACVVLAVLELQGIKTGWLPEQLMVDPLKLWLFMAFMQGIGMVTDGLDGWYARTFAKPTSEGQFLDPLMDKIFVWTTWVVLTCLFTRSGAFGLDTWYGSVYWWIPSGVLLWFDFKSTRKHWQNYRRDRSRGKVNENSGAVTPGKLKFIFENMVISCGLLALFPLRWELPFALHCVMAVLILSGCIIGLYLSVRFATLSLLQRGVIMTREQRLEAKYRPVRFAEAVPELDECA